MKTMLGIVGMVVMMVLMMVPWASQGQDVTKDYSIKFKSTYSETLDTSRNMFRIMVVIESDADLMEVIGKETDFSISLGQWGIEQVVEWSDIVRISNRSGYVKSRFDGGVIYMRWNSSRLTIIVNYNSSIFGDNVVDLMGENGKVSGSAQITVDIYTYDKDENILFSVPVPYNGQSHVSGAYGLQKWSVNGYWKYEPVL